MRLAGDVHLTYCTNIHAGETWTEVRANLERHVLAVKAKVAPDRELGVGLRLSGKASEELAKPTALAECRRFLADHGLYVFTINGFPYGPFHGTRVKADVYLPDWLDDERLRYTNRLADLLAALVPEGVAGTISTVPGCFRARGNGAARVAIAMRIVRHVAHLVEVEQRTGRAITLALEPEPACLIETLDEAAAFFADHLYTAAAADALRVQTGLDRDGALAALRRHVGVCLDACHAAVEFEDLGAALARLRAVGVPVAKVQLGAGLRVAPVDAAARAALAPFAEGVYLHQVVARAGDSLVRHDDLPDALAGAADDDEWRVHFHVPLFRAELPPFTNTQAYLADLLAEQRRAPISTHLEVETYTWDVLPAEYRDEPVVDAIARELAWVIERLQP
jgi:sugar phosphate isomerase/epimerase